MKRTHLLALTTALMIATGTAFAGPNCKKNCPKNNGDSASQEGVYEVAERDGEDVSSLGRQLVYQFLEKERSYYRFSHSVFGSPENYQNSQNS